MTSSDVHPGAVASGRSAWRGPDLQASAEWIRELTPAEIADLDRALLIARARQLSLEAMTVEDFPLDGARALLEEVSVELEEGRGFILLRGLPVARYSVDEIRTLYWGIGLHLGVAVPQSPRYDLIGDVCDLKLPIYAGNGRGYTSNAGLSYHSDTTDVSVLLCIRGARTGGESLISSSVEVHNEILRLRPDLLEALYRPMPFARTSGARPGETPWFEAPVFSSEDGHFSSRFTRVLVRNLDFVPDAPRPSAEQLEALDLMEAVAADDRFVLKFTMGPGDIQFINSHVTFHNRTPFEDWPEPERRRHLLRLWLSVPNSRPLSDLLAPVFGATAPGAVRGGVEPEPGRQPRFTTLEG
jgi:hypothetical protein